MLLAFWLLGQIVWPPWSLAESVSEGAALKLKSLKIIGNQIISSKAIKSQLTISLPTIWPWKKLPTFTEGELEADLERVKALYRQQGFYHTEVSSTVQQDAKGQAEVTIHLNEGPWIQVANIEIRLLDQDAALDLAPLEIDRPLKTGDRFIEGSYDNLKRLYLNYLLEHGYPRGNIEGKVYLDEEKNSADIVLSISSGPLSYFGESRVAGRPETPDYIILRKMTFKPGELFDFRKIYQSQKDLYKLDLFSSVAVTPEETAADEADIPISIRVKEKPKRSFTGGLGWGTEDQVRARLGLRWRNIGGGGRYLDFEGKFSSIDSKFASTFTNPQLWGSYADLIMSSGLMYRDYPSFDDKTLFFNNRLERDLPWNWKVYGGYLLQFDEPSNIPATTMVMFKEPQDQTFRTSLVFLGFQRDTTDNALYPTQGGLFYLNGEVSPKFFGANLQFASARTEGRRYINLWQKELVLALRAGVGLLQPIQDTGEIPIFRRFYTGGYNTVRGYRLFRLGPRDAAGNYVGGNALLEGGAELRFPIYQDLRGVGFLDCGNVYPKIADLDAGRLKYGAGFGLRYNTPIGPVGVDVGFPLNPSSGVNHKYQVYFTIGQSF